MFENNAAPFFCLATPPNLKVTEAGYIPLSPALQLLLLRVCRYIASKEQIYSVAGNEESRPGQKQLVSSPPSSALASLGRKSSILIIGY